MRYSAILAVLFFTNLAYAEHEAEVTHTICESMSAMKPNSKEDAVVRKVLQSVSES